MLFYALSIPFKNLEWPGSSSDITISSLGIAHNISGIPVTNQFHSRPRLLLCLPNSNICGVFSLDLKSVPPTSRSNDFSNTSFLNIASILSTPKGQFLAKKTYF